jgi:predicted Zn-dependent protease
MRHVARCLLILSLLQLSVGCAMMSQADEIKMGRESAPKFEQQNGGLYPDPVVQQYVNSVGMRMAEQAGRPDLPWQFRVLNSNQVNAFALPGGYVYLTRGLLFRLRNEAELAGVLGHEAGHVAHRDTAHQIQTAQNTQLASTGAGIVAGIFGIPGVGEATSLVGQLSLLKYGRGQEHDADLAGLKYMSVAGYNPEAMVTVMETLKHASAGKSKSPQFLSTHPDPGNREEYLTEAIRKNYPIQAEQGMYAPDEFRQRVLARIPR